MKNKNHFRKLLLLALLLSLGLIFTSCSRGDMGAADEAAPPAAGPQAAEVPPPVAEAPAEAVAEAEVATPWALYGAFVADDTGDIADAEMPDEVYYPAAVPDDAVEVPQPGDAPQAEEIPQAEAPTPADASPEVPVQAPSPLGVELMQRMIIRSADMGLNTLYYYETIAGVEATVANRGGFIESSRQWMVYNEHANMMLWRAEYVIRVPVGLFDITNQELLAQGQVRFFSTASRDATHEFNDLGSRLEIRIAEEARVQRMLDDATELNDIIDLEARLTSLRLVIDAYRRRREEIDHLANFSTITLSVFEVVVLPEIEEECEEDDEEDYIVMVYGFGERIGGAFGASASFTVRALEMAAVFLATIILPVGLLGMVGLVVYLVAKKVAGDKWPLRQGKP